MVMVVVVVAVIIVVFVVVDGSQWAPGGFGSALQLFSSFSHTSPWTPEAAAAALLSMKWPLLLLPLAAA